MTVRKSLSEERRRIEREAEAGTMPAAEAALRLGMIDWMVALLDARAIKPSTER